MPIIDIDGDTRCTDGEQFTRVVRNTHKGSTTVVGRNRCGPGVYRPAGSWIVIEDDARRDSRNLGHLVIDHRQLEGRCRLIATGICCGVADQRGSYRECISWLVIRRGCRSRAVVFDTWGRP